MAEGSIPVFSESLYVFTPTPALMPISVEQAEGPTVILVLLLVVLCGINLALYSIYLYLFRGVKRDTLLLQAAVLLSVACNVVLAVLGAYFCYERSLVTLYTRPGWDINEIEWYVPLFHWLQAIPDAIGQIYFVVRIAKLFDMRRTLTRAGAGVALAGIATQFALMVVFGTVFRAVHFKSRLLDPAKRHWVQSIISAWAVIFILLEFAMTLTTMARLFVLRRQTSMDSARRVLVSLAIYSLQGQILLTTCSLTSVYLFQHSVTGWYSPLYLCSGGLYTMVLLANLIYRSALSSSMSATRSQPDKPPRTHEFNLSAVTTYPDSDESRFAHLTSPKTTDMTMDLEAARQRPESAATATEVHPTHFVESHRPSLSGSSRSSAKHPKVLIVERTEIHASPHPVHHPDA